MPAGVKRWHCAARDDWFSHAAFEVPGEGCSAQWREPLDAALYDALP